MALPLFVKTFFAVRTRKALCQLIGGYALIWGLYLRIACSTDFGNYRYWWVPYALMGNIGVGLLLESHQSATGGSGEEQ